MRTTIEKIMFLSPYLHIKNINRIRNILNGAIIRLPAFSNDSYLIAWKAKDREILLFGSMNIVNHNVTLIDDMQLSGNWNGR